MYSELVKAQIFRQFKKDIDYTIRIFYNQSIPQKDIKRCQDYIFCKLSMIKDILEQEGQILKNSFNCLTLFIIIEIL